MNKTILVNVFYFLLGIGLSFLLFSQDANKGSEITMTMDASQGMDVASMHSHAMFEVDTSVPVPIVYVEALKDTKDGYNIHITTKNYTFTPEKVNSEPVQNEGHAHIYVNGVKAARLYGNWFNLPSSELKEGDNLVEVTLNANDHSEWVLDGQHISATKIVVK